MTKQTEIAEKSPKSAIKKTVQVKQDLYWHYASMYLEGLNFFGILQKNHDFNRIFNELVQCVNDNLETNYDGNILDTYVVVEKEVILQEIE